MTRTEIEAVVKETVMKALILQMFADKIYEHEVLEDILDEDVVLQAVASTLQGDRDRLEALMEAGYEQDKVAMNHIIRDISDEIEKALPPQA